MHSDLELDSSPTIVESNRFMTLASGDIDDTSFAIGHLRRTRLSFTTISVYASSDNPLALLEAFSYSYKYYAVSRAKYEFIDIQLSIVWPQPVLSFNL